MEKIFSYCKKCMCTTYFVLVGSHFVCEECGKPFERATVKRTNVTQMEDKDEKIFVQRPV